MANADTTPPTQAQDGSGGVGAVAGQVAPDDGIKVGADLADAANVGAEYLNLYQQYALAVRMILPTTWAMTRTRRRCCSGPGCLVTANVRLVLEGACPPSPLMEVRL